MMIEYEINQYYNAFNFLKSCSYSELEEVFTGLLSELFSIELKNKWLSSKDFFEELCKTIFEHLNSFGWSDEDIIKEVLKNRNEKYILIYVDENHAQEDYFEILKVI